MGKVEEFWQGPPMCSNVSYIGPLGSELQICLDCGGLTCVGFDKLGFRVRLCCCVVVLGLSAPTYIIRSL